MTQVTCSSCAHEYCVREMPEGAKCPTCACKRFHVLDEGGTVPASMYHTAVSEGLAYRTLASALIKALMIHSYEKEGQQPCWCQFDPNGRDTDKHSTQCVEHRALIQLPDMLQEASACTPAYS